MMSSSMFRLLMTLCATASFSACGKIPKNDSVVCPSVKAYSQAEQLDAMVELDALAKDKRYVMIPRMMEDYHVMRVASAPCAHLK